MSEEATALISRGGRAVVRRDETYWVLTPEEPEPRLADATHWTHLRAIARDLELVPAGAPPFAGARARMIERWREKLGLDLLLFCMDRDDDDDSRRKYAGVLDEVLGNVPWLFDRLREIVLSTEPPVEADVDGAKALAESANAERVRRLFDELAGARGTIAAVVAAWRAAIKSLATPAEQTESAAVGDRLRVVGRAVIALRSAEDAALDALRTFCAEALTPELTNVTPDAKAMIDRFLGAIDAGRAATREVIAIDNATAIAGWIDERLRASEPLTGVDRSRCDPVLRAAERAAGGDPRARFAEAVLALLGDLVMKPNAKPLSAEWPAGLFVVAQRVAWMNGEKDQLRRLLVGVLYHLRHDRAWYRAPRGGVLGSVVLEAHRAARFAGLDASDHTPALVASFDTLRASHDPELGSLLGLLSSYGGANVVDAIKLLRRIDLGARNAALGAIGREHLRWALDIRPLIDAVLGVIGGDAKLSFLHERDKPTADEQRWAALVVRTLGALTSQEEARVSNLLVPQPVSAKGTIKAPSWAPGKRAA